MTDVSAWSDAELAAALFAIDPIGTVGVSLRCRAGPLRDRWVDLFRSLLPKSMPVSRVPLGIAETRLLGGLDLAATLSTGQPVLERGVLVAADGGVVFLPMAERMSPQTAAHLSAAIDTREVCVERDGMSRRIATRFGVVALDEGDTADEQPPSAIVDRVAFHIHLDGISIRTIPDCTYGAAAIAAARRILPRVRAERDISEGLCEAALALGIESIRRPLLALRVACGAAALAGRTEVSIDDAEVAMRLVLLPNAIVFPDVESQQAAEPDPSDYPTDTDKTEAEAPSADGSLADVLLRSTQSALPQGLLDGLALGASMRVGRSAAGRRGSLQAATRRGRQIGVRRGNPRRGAPLDVIATLRAAAPWQQIRKSGLTKGPVQIRRDDLRIRRLKQRSQTTAVFAVDASGSAAAQRLAEAKGAIERLLADCYARRDQVAMLAFRGTRAEVMLPPTRSLVRAKRSLAAQPGGGGTPLAAGIDAALAVADGARRRGESPLFVLLTDGRANIARSGVAARGEALADALHAAHAIRDSEIPALVVDTSPRPQSRVQELAAAMTGRYLPLPHADSGALTAAVRNAASAVCADQ